MAMAVQPGRFLDGAVLTLFVMILSSLSLYLFGEMWALSQDPRLSRWNIGLVMQKLFPFKKTFDFNLTHILLFAVCIMLFSLRTDDEENSSSAAKAVKDAKGSRKKPTTTTTRGNASHGKSGRRNLAWQGRRNLSSDEEEQEEEEDETGEDAEEPPRRSQSPSSKTKKAK